MKRAIAIFLAVIVVACLLTSCRTSRKQIKPLFSHVSAQIFII